MMAIKVPLLLGLSEIKFFGFVLYHQTKGIENFSAETSCIVFSSNDTFIPLQYLGFRVFWCLLQ